MPFFTTRPTSRISPIADDDVQIGAGEQQQRERAGRATAAPRAGSARAGRKRPNCTTQDDEDERRGDREHRSAARGTTAAATRTGRRPRWCSRPAASGPPSFVWISATALPRSRPSRWPVTSAICRRFSRCRMSSPSVVVRLRQRSRAESLRPSARADRRRGHLRGIHAVRVRIAHAHREWCGPAAAARSARRRARRPTAAPTPARPSGPAGRPPPDRSSHVRLGVAALHADDVDDAVDAFSSMPSTCSEISASVSGSSPNTLTSIGVGAPSRSPSMSCSSWTNSISSRGAASVSLSRRSLMISSAGSPARPRASAGRGCRPCSAASRTGRAPIRCGA